MSAVTALGQFVSGQRVAGHATAGHATGGHATARPRPAERPERPRLSLVPAPAHSTAGRLPFVLAVGAVLAVGLVLLLLLHTLAAQDGFTVHSLQRTSAALADQEQQLALDNLQAQSPTDLAARAKALGMVPATVVKVTQRRGRPVALLRGFAPAPKPSASPSAKASPSPAASASPSPTTKHSATVRPSPAPTHH